jgi:hypothetical protein
MSIFETVREALTPAIGYPMVTLFPGGPIGNDVGLNPAAQPGGGAVPEPQVDSLLDFKSFFFLEGCGKPLSF